MIRVLTALFFALALLRVFLDWQLAKFNETAFKFQPIGQVWFDYDRDSFLSVQPGVERYLSSGVWEIAVGPMMHWPLAPTLFAVSILIPVVAKLLRRRKD